MALNLTDLIANEKDYPDATVFVVGKDPSTGDDLTVTMGDFRSDYRSKDADYRRKTTSVAEERRRLAEERVSQQAAFAEAESKLAEWTKQIMTTNPSFSKAEVEDELENDPRYKKLTTKLDALTKGLEERDRKVDSLVQVIETEQKNRWINAHRTTLAQLKSQDKDLDEEELIRFAQERGTPRLDDAYYLMNRDRLMDAERKKAVDEAVPKLTDKIKRELTQPVLPSTRLVKPSAESFVGHGAMDKAASAALNDPDIMAMLLGQSSVT